MIKFTLRLTEEEKNMLDIKSKEYKNSKNDILRQLITTKLLDMEKDYEVMNELKESLKEHAFQLQKIGNVLNQINKNFYQGKSIKIEEIERKLDDLWQSINL